MVLLILLSLAAWCVLPLPLAIVVGHAIRGGRTDPRGRRSSFDLAA